MIPSDAKVLLGLKGRVVRISLRTKDPRRAKRACLLKSLIMDEHFPYPAPWEVEAGRRAQLYRKGLRLQRSYGRIDLNDEFAVERLTDEGVDLEAYRLALDELANERRPQQPGPSPETTAPLASPPRPEPAPAPQQRVANLLPQLVARIAVSGDELVDTALSRFVQAKRLATRAGTADKYGDQCRLFLKVVADGDPSQLRMSDITPQALRHYADTLPRLPPGCGSAIRRRSANSSPRGERRWPRRRVSAMPRPSTCS